jgi:hypothetical protein
MPRDVLFSAAVLLFVLGLAPAQAAKKLCPDGQFYTCTGGINGVNCRCVKPSSSDNDVSPFDLIWDIDGGTTSIAQGEIVLSARIASTSACTIDYTLAVNRLADGVADRRLVENVSGTLSAVQPTAIVQVEPDSSSTRLRQYLRLRGRGAAQQCSIQEFLTFEITTVAYDAQTHAVLNQRNVRPDFVLDDQDRIPPITPARPAPIGAP